MEEREKIIKKTAELVVKDISKIVKPIMWWMKVVLAGIVCGASSFFLNKIGKRVRTWFMVQIFNEDYDSKELLNTTSNIIFGLLIIYFLMGLFTPFLLEFLGIGPFTFLKTKIGIKFLITTNLIGLIGEGFYYFADKKTEAEKLLKKKESQKQEDIKIEGKKKEAPKLTGGVNT